VVGKSIREGKMEEAPENGKESPHSAHANGMNEWNHFSLSLTLGILNYTFISHNTLSTVNENVLKV
jgi:hypothetical protein